MSWGSSLSGPQMLCVEDIATFLSLKRERERKKEKRKISGGLFPVSVLGPVELTRDFILSVCMATSLRGKRKGNIIKWEDTRCLSLHRRCLRFKIFHSVMFISGCPTGGSWGEAEQSDHSKGSLRNSITWHIEHPICEHPGVVLD